MVIYIKVISKLFMSKDEIVLLKSIIEYKHSSRKNLTRGTISNTLKRKAVDDISKWPFKLLSEEVQSNVMDVTLKILFIIFIFTSPILRAIYYNRVYINTWGQLVHVIGSNWYILL